MTTVKLYRRRQLELVFQNAVGGALGALGSGLQASATPGSLYVSLHTADPGEAGTQATSEVSYSGYARVALARRNTVWEVPDVNGWVARNIAAFSFPAVALTQIPTPKVTHVGIGTAPTGPGSLLWRTVLPEGPVSMTAKKIVRFPAQALEVRE